MSMMSAMACSLSQDLGPGGGHERARMLAITRAGEGERLQAGFRVFCFGSQSPSPTTSPAPPPSPSQWPALPPCSPSLATHLRVHCRWRLPPRLRPAIRQFCVFTRSAGCERHLPSASKHGARCFARCGGVTMMILIAIRSRPYAAPSRGRARARQAIVRAIAPAFVRAYVRACEQAPRVQQGVGSLQSNVHSTPRGSHRDNIALNYTCGEGGYTTAQRGCASRRASAGATMRQRA